MNQLVLRKVKLKGEVRSKSPTLLISKRIKTLDLLDPLKPTTNNYNTVAKQQGVNKSVVFK